jgi:ABC-type Fe3+-siderophore transport system permease subunit
MRIGISPTVVSAYNAFLCRNLEANEWQRVAVGAIALVENLISTSTAYINWKYIHTLSIDNYYATSRGWY